MFNRFLVSQKKNSLIQEQKEISFGVITDFWKDTGTPFDIIEANKFLLEKMQESFNGEKEEDVNFSEFDKNA